MNRRVALGISGVAVAVAAVGGVAYAADSGGTTSTASPTPQTSDAPSKGHAGKGHSAEGHSAEGKAGKGRARGLASHALHGQFTVERKGQPTVLDVQRGEITK